MDANGNPKVFFKGDTEEDMFENMTDEYVSDEDLSFTDEEDESTEKNVEGQHQPDPFPFLNLPEELQTEVFRKVCRLIQA
ncbi:hypothetical protein ANCCAN_25769 [Ancylostoma caninum]|uniref:Uncharacterized protein n=1 Tax=Ancylostoma caninum TaxID=29170 RepID=A0A368FE80_ANCCA|nr:hypothetical protein ANCCAN_25769 [Ancylostoma caninum]